ncbi:S1 family peptidase [Longimycelium tulufanense]|uniref:S1 family peptidase n=1 Tax=Longimycelium tulufanense TaxID=907463 RepID=UPI00166BA2AF|nr:S1 family peptidase [Longimycelium tulufanense]
MARLGRLLARVSVFLLAITFAAPTASAGATEKRPLPLGTMLDFEGVRCLVSLHAARWGTPRFLLSSGHCGVTGTKVTAGGTPVGEVVAHDPDSPTYVLVRVDTERWKQTNDRWSLKGTTEAPVGASACSRTHVLGLQCGRIQQKGTVVRHGQSRHYLTRTDLCAPEPGALVVSGDQAQGIVTDYSGDPRIGCVTLFQPVNPILSRHGLRPLLS